MTNILTPEAQRKYRKHRTGPYPLGVKTALQVARYETAEPKHEFLSALRWGGHEKVHGEVEGFQVIVEQSYDETSRLGEDDVTGTFSDTWEEGAIKNEGADRYGNGGDAKWYIPSNYDRTERLKDLRNLGMSKSVALDAYRACLQEAMRDDQQRTYYLMHVTILLEGEELADDYLGGIDIIDEAAYLMDVAAEMIDEGIYKAREALPKKIDEVETRLDVLRSHEAKP